MDLLDDDESPQSNAPEFSVSDLTGAIKRTLEGAFGRVRVRGEVGRVVRAKSGHLYYDIKDDRNVINCTTWKGQVPGLGLIPEEGMEVVVTGRLSNYGPQSRYNLNVDTMEVAGEGALMVMLEKRRKALAAEGLFDEARKKKLPFLPEVIGVVTSPTGAVIRDILHRLRDRFPREVLIWPGAVQGERCAAEVARAIRGFNALGPLDLVPRPDLLIVARGGGSLEDLWGFNEEIVVRAAAESDIPLISAVGHETDTTLIDYASDLRAPTPTGAAEKAVPVRIDLMNWVRDRDAVLTRAITNAVGTRGQRLQDLSRGLPRPEALFDTARQRLDMASVQLGPALKERINEARARLDRLSAGLTPALDRAVAHRRLTLGQAGARLSPERLQSLTRQTARDLARASQSLTPARAEARLAAATQSLAQLTPRFAQAARASTSARRERLDGLSRLHQTLGYKETLNRGYAVIRADDTVQTTKSCAETHTMLEIEFADGRLAVSPTGAQVSKSHTPKAKSKPPNPDDQGSLF